MGGIQNRKLTIKNNKDMTKAKTIIEGARKKLVDFICFEAPLIYHKFGWDEPEPDDDYVIPSENLCRTIRINVEVDNSYLDVEDTCYEDVEVTEVVVSRDGEVWFNTADDDYTVDEVSIEELADVAEVLELSYNK